jgi:hypothetical protein
MMDKPLIHKSVNLYQSSVHMYSDDDDDTATMVPKQSPFVLVVSRGEQTFAGIQRDDRNSEADVAVFVNGKELAIQLPNGHQYLVKAIMKAMDPVLAIKGTKAIKGKRV